MENNELIQPVLQYPSNLVFAVSKTDVSNLLTVLKIRTIVLGNFRIDFMIIGESHCITVRHRNEIMLQEVLACTDIPAILQADSHKFATLDTYQHTRCDYQSTIWFADTLQKSCWQEQSELRLKFPEVFGQVPFTSIGWITSAELVKWRTVHVYPLATHTTYVHTESCFDLTKRVTYE